MKKIYNVLLLFNCLFFLSNSYAAVHIITVTENPFIFSPNSLNVIVGDTIAWTRVSGSHTTTSTSVPAGALSWDAPLNSSIPAFAYIVTHAGTYQYVCTPHASMGMTGSFTASPSTGIEVPNTTSDFNFYNVSPSIYNISYKLTKVSDIKISIYDITGSRAKILLSEIQSAGEYTSTVALNDLRSGIYFIEMLSGSQRIIKRMIIE